MRKYTVNIITTVIVVAVIASCVFVFARMNDKAEKRYDEFKEIEEYNKIQDIKRDEQRQKYKDAIKKINALGDAIDKDRQETIRKTEELRKKNEKIDKIKPE